MLETVSHHFRYENRCLLDAPSLKLLADVYHSVMVRSPSPSVVAGLWFVLEIRKERKFAFIRTPVKEGARIALRLRTLFAVRFVGTRQSRQTI